MTPEERFWAKVNKTETCWEWTANNTRGGYGNFMPANGVARSAHRYSYEISVGPIPAGLDIDHLCRNRSCVNPAHLEVVTTAENVRRGNVGRRNATKAACPAGHLFAGPNLYVTPTGRRQCRACKRDQLRSFRERQSLI